VHRRRDPEPSQSTGTAEPGKRSDSVKAAIGHARAELREIVGMLTATAQLPPRRRPKITSFAVQSGSLFPS